MKVYRGPSTKPFWDDTHELVSTISPKTLEDSIRDGSSIRFNITKEALERQAVCTARFEDEDIVPMINGLMSKLKSQQVALLEIKSVMKNNELEHDDKINEISQIINKL